MAIKTKAFLTIEKLKEDGNVPFVKLALEQFIEDHARVKISIDLEHMGEKVLNKPMQRIALINEKFRIDIKNIADENEEEAPVVYTFLGLITDVQIELDAGQHGWMYIYGSSPSIELERGKMLRTHSNKKLNEIVERVIEDKVNVLVVIDPEYKSIIDFSMQYYETDYQYLRRIAWMYQEKLFFNGNNVVFGKINKENTTLITYNKDLVEVKLNSRLISNRFSQYFHTLEELKTAHNLDVSDTGNYTGIAGTQSDLLNPKRESPDDEHKPNIPIAAPVNSPGNLKELTEKRKLATMNQMFFVTGKTNVYRTTIGELLEIDFDKKMTVEDSIGTLRITRALHIFYEVDKYYNEFEACQNKYDYFPHKEPAMPVAQPLTATVINNQDEKKLGRVQLQFDFEKETCQFWFRCSTPDGGGNKHIGKERNRGMIFVPEHMDRVYLDFMEGNPDKPFVAGSFFHGSNASNHSNNIRSISDKANNYIQWNSGAGIRTQDKKGNYIHLDGEGNINARSSETIVLRCGKDGEGSGIMLTKDGLIHLLGNHIIIDAKDDTRAAVGAAPQPLSILINTNPEVSMALPPDGSDNGGGYGNKPKVSIDITEPQIDMNSKSAININSDQISILGSTQTKVDGGGGTVIEKGGEVHIN
jgi:hypothetical protein